MKKSDLQKIIKEEIRKIFENVWTSQQKKAVKKLDDEFTEFLIKKNVYPYSKTASDLWRSSGFQKKFKAIFEKNDVGEL